MATIVDDMRETQAAVEDLEDRLHALPWPNWSKERDELEDYLNTIDRLSDKLDEVLPKLEAVRKYGADE